MAEQSRITQTALSSVKAEDVPFGIYIHWPFCLSKCPYCDFFSQVCRNVNQDEIIDACLDDLDFYGKMTSGRDVTSIFFGGGTPSLIRPENVERVIDKVAQIWHLSPNIEISLEANPNTRKSEMFADLKRAGINRLSLGVQALNENDLRFLGRTHSLDEALSSAEEVLEMFENHSMDLIYARPEQLWDDWQKELELAVSLGFKHLSLYQLTIEEGTIFAKKGVKVPDEETASRFYHLTNEFLAANGYPRYEVSNYALPEYECRHNLLYWQGNDYVGVGHGAHGRLQTSDGIFATTHPRILEKLSSDERAEELLIMGLRLDEGIDKHRFFRKCGREFESVVNMRNLELMQAEKLLINTAKKIFVTSKGFPVLNKIIEDLTL